MSNPFASRSSVRASKRSLHRAKAKLACGLFMLGQTMLPAALAEQATFTPPTPIEVSGTVPLSNNSPVVPESVMAGLTGAVTVRHAE